MDDLARTRCFDIVGKIEKEEARGLSTGLQGGLEVGRDRLKFAGTRKKAGQEWGKLIRKRKRGHGDNRDPLFSKVPRDRIELPTRGFSDTAFKFPMFLK
jgi:hypothetical protein